MSFYLYLAKRAGTVLVTLVLLSFLVFLFANILPGSAAVMKLGQYGTEERIEQLEERMDLNKPFHERYYEWITGIISGNWGKSLIYDRPIAELVIPRFFRSIQLALITMFLVTTIGISLGVIAAVKQDSIFDLIFSSVIYTGVSLPEYVWGIVLILIFGGPILGVLPSGGYASFEDGLFNWLRHLTLPSMALAFALLAHILRQTRSEMIEVLQTDYIRMARIKGLSERTVLIKHALRNGLLPTITLIALDFGWLMGGLVVVEEVFAFPGLGRLMVGAIQNRDIPLLQVVALIIAATYTLGNTAADVIYTYLDPRIEFE